MTSRVNISNALSYEERRMIDEEALIIIDLKKEVVNLIAWPIFPESIFIKEGKVAGWKVTLDETWKKD